MPTFRTTIDVCAVRATKDSHIVWDGGSFRVRAGEWLVEGSGGYGPCVFSDEEFRQEFEELSLLTEDDGRLIKALKSGHL